MTRYSELPTINLPLREVERIVEGASDMYKVTQHEQFYGSQWNNYHWLVIERLRDKRFFGASYGGFPTGAIEFRQVFPKTVSRTVYE